MLPHDLIVNITVCMYVCVCLYYTIDFVRLYDSSLYPSPHEQTFPLFSPSLTPACRLRICPMFLCDKTPNPIKTKGLSTPPHPPSTPSLTLSLNSLSHHVTTRSFFSPYHYLLPPSSSAPFVWNLKVLFVIAEAFKEFKC